MRPLGDFAATFFCGGLLVFTMKVYGFCAFSTWLSIPGWYLWESLFGTITNMPAVGIWLLDFEADILFLAAAGLFEAANIFLRDYNLRRRETFSRRVLQRFG